MRGVCCQEKFWMGLSLLWDFRPTFRSCEWTFSGILQGEEEIPTLWRIPGLRKKETGRLRVFELL